MCPPISPTAAPISETLATLRSNPETGLSRGEVQARTAKYGLNEVPEKHGHPLVDFLKKFWGISAWMIELILALSAVLHNYPNLVVVGALLVVNAVISFTQERRAAAVAEALRQRLHVSVRVLRDGAWKVVPARELVPGDIVRVRPGDIVPADLQLLAGGLAVDQSTLTGESQDVDRSPGDVLASGSVVRRGEGTAVVTATGAKTFYGRTTELVQIARPKLHVEAVVAGVVRWLLRIVAVMVGVVVIVSLVRHAELVQMIPLMLVLLVSGIPVALPVMFTVSMALGASELARRGVLVTRTSASEDAATMDVLCVDKTGTITVNQLAVTEVIPLGDATADEVLSAGALASQEADQDPIDLAFIAAEKARAKHPAASVISFTPFDPETRRTEAIIEEVAEKGTQRYRVMKGAVRALAGACALKEGEVEALEARVAEFASKGYRTLAVARGPEDGDSSIIGLVTLYDPPRPDATRLLAALRDLGVSVKILTGDALAVAKEIARMVGLTNVRRFADLKARTGPVADDFLADVDGFAEIYPEGKYDVVRFLQAAGHVAGMTGDGVNDAPALRQAEVGIAVSGATDVAKSAASVVLTDPGLTNIVALVEQGRAIYQRILTWIINKISRTILKAVFVSVAYLVTGQFVVSAFAMLLLVFMTDFAIITLGTDRARGSKKPETWKIGGYVAASVALGIAMVAEALLLLYVTWTRFGLDAGDGTLSTFSFQLLLFFSVFSVVSARERRWFWSTRPSSTLVGALLGDLAAGIVLTIVGLPGLTPLPWDHTLAVLAYSAGCCLVVNDSIKVAMLRRTTGGEKMEGHVTSF